jgi:hypothetical protein
VSPSEDSLKTIDRGGVCNVLITNDIHSSYNQFYSTFFLSALQVSSESSRSSSGAWYNILYYTVQSVQSCCKHAVAHLVESLRYKPEGRGFGSRWCHCNFSLT